MRGERYVPPLLPRQRRIGKMADRISERRVIVAFSHRGRQFQPRHIDAADHLAGHHWNGRCRRLWNMTLRSGLGKTARRYHRVYFGFCAALIVRGLYRDDGVEEQTAETECDEHAIEPAEAVNVQQMHR